MLFVLMSCWLLAIAAGAEEVPAAFERGNPAEHTVEAEFDPFDPMTEAPKLIRTMVEFIELPHKDLTRLLMADDAATADATALRMRVQQRVNEDHAKIIDTQMILGRSGQRMDADAHHEFIYPTEYEPPGFDAKIQEELMKINAFPVGLGNPVAFETRNVGSALQSEPTLSPDDKIIDLRFTSSITWHTGNTIWSESVDTLGNTYQAAMPDFYTLSTNTAITCMSGQYVLVSILSAMSEEGKPDPDRRVMVFVKCDVLPVLP